MVNRIENISEGRLSDALVTNRLAEGILVKDDGPKVAEALLIVAKQEGLHQAIKNLAFGLAQAEVFPKAATRLDFV